MPGRGDGVVESCRSRALSRKTAGAAGPRIEDARLFLRTANAFAAILTPGATGRFAGRALPR
jgi:hypothetical protein